MWWAPLLIKGLNFLQFWKKNDRKQSTDGKDLEVTRQFYEENEKKRIIPRAGGILIWVTTIFLAVVFWLFLKADPSNKLAQFLNFVDRRETFIPIGALFFASLLGLADDILAVLPSGGNYFAGGLKLTHRLGGVVLISILIGLWFHLKIGGTMHTITVPWFDSETATWLKLNLNDIHLPLNWLDTFLNSFGFTFNLSSGGWLIVPITIFVLLALWSSSMIDGFDGLATGVFIPIYLSFAGLAFATHYYAIATFMMVMVGAMSAYLWFNIPPAKFYMGDTGTLGILLTLGVVAMLIDKIYVLPIAGLVLLATSASVIIQLSSKKLRHGKKVFLAAPLHHHFEAKGWLRHQVTMRYWLISIMASVLGFAIGLIIN